MQIPTADPYGLVNPVISLSAYIEGLAWKKIEAVRS